MSGMKIRRAVVDWLLESDPAIRWQVMKGILRTQPETYERERSLLPQTGWCARLLALQDNDGLWNHSLYNGKWLSTTYSLYWLKVLGLSPGNCQALRGCDQLFTQGLYQNREIRFSRTKTIPDMGVSALVLSLCCYFGYEAEAIPLMAHFLASQQSAENNWLPNDSPSASAYTFETTLLVLEALMQYQNRYRDNDHSVISTAVRNGQEFLLENNLGFVNPTPIKSGWASFSFPSYWFYDLLTALEYFCHFGTNKDGRLNTAIELLRRKETEAGTWLLGSPHPGKTYFEMEKSGKPSRWITLRALRVLAWWKGG